MRPSGIARVALAIFALLSPAARSAPPERLDRAAALTVEGDYAAAIGEYRAFLSEAPDDRLAPVAAMAIANIHLRVLRDTTEAEKTLSRVLADYRGAAWAAEAAREKAACARSRERWQEAAESYLLALELAAGTPGSESDQWMSEVTVAAADCHYRAGDPAKVIETYEKALVGEPPPEVAAVALFRLGETYESKNEEEKAAESYARVLRSYPSSELFDQAIGKRELIDRHAAIDWRPYAAYSEATRMIAARDLEGALAKIDEVLAAPSDEALAECAEYRKIAIETALRASFREGCERLEAFLDKHPNGQMRGAAERTLERDWGPAADLEERVEEDPENPGLLGQLGGIYLRARAPGRAIDLLERAAALDPENDLLRLQLGYAHAQAGDDTNALESFRSYLDRHPQDTRVMNQIGYLYLGRGEAEQAISYFRMYVEAAPDEANAHDSMGEGLLAAGRFEEAAREYEMAVSIDPSFANSYFMLGRARTELKDTAGAIAAYERFLELSPTGAQADQARAALEELRAQ
ncbi:MAG: tetratricopeptide repeat protein [Candidatus Eisenbacteria bacterium]|nr:tetratricopeptide repeat protein [Candidatus Eisenbacteria bacterium]